MAPHSARGRFRLDSRKNCCSERAAVPLHHCSKSDGVNIPTGLQKYGDGALRDTASGHGGGGLRWGILVVLPNLNGFP